MEQLARETRAAGIQLTSRQLDRFQRYGQLLEAGSKRANLTGLREWDAVRDELILRSLRFAIPLTSDDACGSVIDIGTGAGIPGLILAIALPDIDFLLIDATGKKIAFLQSAISDLQLENVSAHQARAEEFAREPANREQFDAAIARSVGSLAELAELLLPFCRIGGRALTMKSLDIDPELKAAGFAARIMGADSARTHIVSAPGPAEPDALIEWRKRTTTPHKYPRRVGLPHSSPLLQSSGRATGGLRR